MQAAMLRQVEESIAQQRKTIEYGDALERLKSNRDFKKLITEGYFEKEAIRLVFAKSNPALQSEESQKSLDNQINAIGSFEQYLHGISHSAEMARKNIGFDEATREEILQEGTQQ